MTYSEASKTTRDYRKAFPDLDSADHSPVVGVSGRNNKVVEVEFIEEKEKRFPTVEIDQFKQITKVEIVAIDTLVGNFEIKVGVFTIYSGVINAGTTVGTNVTLDHRNGEVSIKCDQVTTGKFTLIIQSI